MADLSAAIAKIAPRLKCSALYAPAQKTAFDNPAWDEASSRFLIVRLSPFRDVSTSAPHTFLHALARSTLGAGAYLDFSFFPSKPDRSVLDEAGLPWLSGIDSLRTADEFDAILISCSYALELVNLPLVLGRSGFPLRASERRNCGRRLPPVILGGSNALASQGAIFSDGDAFVDGIFFGEGEAGGAELIASLASTVGRPTPERVVRLEEAVPAFWGSCLRAPDAPTDGIAGRSIRPGRCRVDAGRTPFLPETWPALNSENASSARLQLSWGCPSFCSFCFEGWERKPYRELSKERILESARRLARNTGASTVELYSFNFNAHEDALELIHELNAIFDKVNMMSQRADLLVRTPGMLACELAAEKRSFTVGVEGISASMRAFYSKGLRDADLRRLMERFAEEKIRELKLFYIIAGVESEADLDEFRRFCVELSALKDERDPALRAVFSFGYLVRMPFTPLRALGLEFDREHFRSISKVLEEAVTAAGFEFRLAVDWDEYVADQLLVAGGYGLARGLEDAARLGCAFDLGVEGDLIPRLVSALRESGELGPASDGKVLSGPLTAPKEDGHRYPLSFVETAVPQAFLDARSGDALDRVDLGSCMGGMDAAGGDGACLGCSACEDAGGEADERGFLSSHRVRPAPGTAYAAKIAERIREKRRAVPVCFSIRLPASLEGSSDAFRSTFLLRSIFSRDEGLTGRLLRAEDAFSGAPPLASRGFAGATGESVVALFGIGGKSPSGAPRLSEEDAERARAALEEALGLEAGAVRMAETWNPAEITRLGVRMDLDENFDSALRRVRSWLAGLKLAATEIKGSDGKRIFDIAPKDKKKRVVTGVTLLPVAEAESGTGSLGPTLLIEGGAKLDLSLLFPKRADRARARISVEELSPG
ncbi:MAG TPA: hypothetical protein DIC34_05695 [Treponema sp.]|nr:hypothetical protein [Treponema sp.]